MIRGGEAGLIERIRKRAGGGTGGQIVTGIGDDCAVFRPRAGEDLVFTTDFLIEDVHFRRDTHSAADIGHKALARGLSDIAAMGAEPQFALLSLALAPWAGDAWVDRFYSGFLRLARKWNTTLAGGDLSHAERLTCDIVVCGAVPRGMALLRSGAKPGDTIHVSGLLGMPWTRRVRPHPRIDIGLAIRGRATAAMDVTDGLALDLHRLCVASSVAADLDHVPVVRGSSMHQALHGGEDYELLFTLPPSVSAPPGGHPIGTIVEGPAGQVRFRGGLIRPRGYDHFRDDQPTTDH